MPAVFSLSNSHPNDASLNRPLHHSKQSPPSNVATPSGSAGADAPIHSSKRTSARDILSKVTLNTPLISVSRSSSHKSKYIYNPALREFEEAFDNSALNPATSLQSTKLPTRSTQSNLYAPSNELDIPTDPRARTPTKSMPVVGATKKQPGAMGKERGKEMQLQSVSQLSLSRSTPVRGRREAARMGKRLRPKAQSSIPVVKTTEQKSKRETLPVRTVQKPPHSVSVLPKRKSKERQPLIPSKGQREQHTHSTVFLTLYLCTSVTLLQ